MNDRDHEIDLMRKLLQSALPPIGDQALDADLWPRMLGRLAQAPPRFGWFEALLAGLIVLGLAAFPQLIPVMLYHL